MPTIGEIVRPNEDAEFASDVQLYWYPRDRRNDRLACGYIWTAKAIDNRHSSIEILEKLQLAFTWEGTPNRYVVIATYGHGKSHLALALANFFGKPAESEVAQRILDNIEHAIGDPAQARKFRDFKQNHGPYLVVCLHGDQMKSLHQQVITGVEAALKEHEQTRDVALPFWFRQAEAFLEGLSEENIRKANEFLETRDIETAILLSRVKDRDSACHELCREVHRHLYGTLPDFGGEISPREIIEWAVGEFCGEGKPFPGMLVLFDEFSAFVRNCASGVPVNPGLALQNLLQGIENSRGKAAFVAFSQHDPDTVAENAFTASRSQEDREDLRHELNRLPSQQRYTLYSSMENVLDAYLSQNAEQWSELLKDRGVLEAVDNANNATMQLFPNRYDYRMGWGEENVNKILTKGCFPLHPLATALLCSVQLRDIAQPRPVLGFLLEEVRRVKDQPAVLNGRPNWVYATRLVDEDAFGEMLADVEYRDYCYAARQLGPDAPEVQKGVLKAMLLYTVAQLPRRMISFTRAIAELSGFSQGEVEQALKEMHERGLIRKDESADTYCFYPAGGGGAEADRYIRAEAGKLKLDYNAVLSLNREWAKNDSRLASRPVSWDRGHEEDWAAAQLFLTRETFTTDVLRRQIKKRCCGSNGLVDAPRGYVIWLLAESDEDVDWFRNNAEKTLDDALEQGQMPVAIGVPDTPMPHLRENILCEQVVQATTPDKRRELGLSAFEDAQKRIARAVDDGLNSLKNNCTFFVPREYRFAVQAANIASNLDAVLRHCYGLAYRNAPPFYTQYKNTNTNLRKSVAAVANLLAKNQLHDLDNVRALSPVAGDIVSKFLQSGATGWGVVTLDYRLQPPTNSQVEKAWELLDETFAPGAGEIPAQKALVPLLNPPYGYDYNQLTLLFCAWYGYNRHNLQLFLSGKLGSFEDIPNALDKPRDFIDTLCYTEQARISRRDPEAAIRRIREIIETANSGEFTQDEAESACAELAEFLSSDEADPNLRKPAESARQRIESALKAARDYDEKADKIKARLSTASKVRDVAECLKAVKDLPDTTCVTVNKPSPEKITESARAQMITVLSCRCAELETLNAITEYGVQRNALVQIKTELTNAGLSELHQRVDQALQKLDAAKNELEAVTSDAASIERLKSMRGENRLQYLRDNLQTLKEMRLSSEQARTLAEDVRKETETAIADAGEFINSIARGVATAKTADEAKDVQTQVQKRLSRYEGTGDYDKLAAYLDKARQLQDYFERINRVKAAAISTPEDLHRVNEELDALDSQYRNTLMPMQREQLEVVRKRVQGEAERKAADAAKWLDAMESRVREQKDLSDVLVRLSSPPPFLAQDKASRIPALKAEIERKLDEDDALHIRELFARIKDRARRRQLLEELSRMLDELEAR